MKADREKAKRKKETKRPTQESLGSGKGKTFMGIVVIWGNAFTFILRFFRHEVVEKQLHDLRDYVSRLYGGVVGLSEATEPKSSRTGRGGKYGVAFGAVREGNSRPCASARTGKAATN
jgi:hypothetical protein